MLCTTIKFGGFLPGSPAFSLKDVQPLTENIIRVLNIMHPCNNPQKGSSIPEVAKNRVSNGSLFLTSGS